MRKQFIGAAIAVLMATVALAVPSAAFAEGHNPEIIPGTPVTRPTGISEVGSFDVDANGTTYQADTYDGRITRTTAAGAVTTLVPSHSGYLFALTLHGGALYYVEVVPAETAFDPQEFSLMSVPTGGGTPKVVVNYSGWHNSHVPDAANTYGFFDLPQSCLDTFPGVRGLEPGREQGSYWSESQQTVATASGIYIADAGRNSILKVTYAGAVSVVAVLPPEPAVRADQAMLDFYSFPQCALGYRYAARPSPHGLTLGPDGSLFTTTVPNGYPYSALALRGGIYKVNPATGTSKRIIGSLKAPFGISATPSGTLYVAELRGGTDGAGGISVVRVNAAIARPLTNIAEPTSVEFVKDKLYVPSGLFDGSLKVIPLTYS